MIITGRLLKTETAFVSSSLPSKKALEDMGPVTELTLLIPSQATSVSYVDILEQREVVVLCREKYEELMSKKVNKIITE
jgi:hypothetical protein